MKKEKSCGCPISGNINTVLLLILLIGGAVFAYCSYTKLNNLTTVIIDGSFGGEKAFKEFKNLVNNPEYKQVKETQSIASFKTMKDSLQSEVEEQKKQENAIDTSAAFSDTTWANNSNEANNLFGLQGTPGNAVINIKNGNFKAVGGAYPSNEFESIIAELKAGKTLETDQIGKAGTLTKEQIEKLLDGVYYYGNKGADIIIVEYSDLLCPFCQRHYNDKTLENLVDNGEGSIALVFKNNPIAQLHPTAPIGAKGVECAGKLGGDELFYKYIDKAFTQNKFDGVNVVEIATEIGLDPEKFVACFTK